MQTRTERLAELREERAEVERQIAKLHRYGHSEQSRAMRNAQYFLSSVDRRITTLEGEQAREQAQAEQLSTREGVAAFWDERMQIGGGIG